MKLRSDFKGKQQTIGKILKVSKIKQPTFLNIGFRFDTSPNVKQQTALSGGKTSNYFEISKISY